MPDRRDCDCDCDRRLDIASATFQKMEDIKTSSLGDRGLDRLKIGILLYDGDHTTAFSDRLHAVPLGALWS